MYRDSGFLLKIRGFYNMYWAPDASCVMVASSGHGSTPLTHRTSPYVGSITVMLACIGQMRLDVVPHELVNPCLHVVEVGVANEEDPMP
jgi:hypothetical protein